MARQPRLFCESKIYHVIMRGNNKQNLFNDDKDRFFFLQRLKKYSHELGISIFAYCLMNNHVHILIGNADRNMSLLIQKIANSYVYYFNRKYDRCGHLFQGRFKSEPVDNEEYFKIVLRYILQNSEQAGLGCIDKYKWNSYKSFIDDSDSCIDVDYAIKLFGSKAAMIQFLRQPVRDECMEFENKIVISDEKALQIIRHLFRINSPYKLEQLKIDEQLQKCKILKSKGLSINQISRVTGISKGIIRIA